jgi:hypothetical protein
MQFFVYNNYNNYIINNNSDKKKFKSTNGSAPLASGVFANASLLVASLVVDRQ